MLKRKTVSLLSPEAELRTIRASTPSHSCLGSRYETVLMKIDGFMEIVG